MLRLLVIEKKKKIHIVLLNCVMLLNFYLAVHSLIVDEFKFIAFVRPIL